MVRKTLMLEHKVFGPTLAHAGRIRLLAGIAYDGDMDPIRAKTEIELLVKVIIRELGEIDG